MRRMHCRKRRARQYRDPVIALHAMHQHVAVAEALECVAREQFVRRFGLLQAQDVGAGLLDQPADEVDPHADRVDVPGDQAHGDRTLLTITRYDHRVVCSSAVDKRSSRMPEG